MPQYDACQDLGTRRAAAAQHEGFHNRVPQILYFQKIKQGRL